MKERKRIREREKDDGNVIAKDTESPRVCRVCIEQPDKICAHCPVGGTINSGAVKFS